MNSDLRQKQDTNIFAALMLDDQGEL